MDFSEELKGVLKSVQTVLIFSGSGISRESGIPTFRDNDGLWNDLDPMIWASRQGFESDPVKIWEWYLYRRKACLDSKPNPGHEALAKLERELDQVLISTQNIDGLHQKAGSSNVIELHGNIFENRCLDCGRNDLSDPDVKGEPGHPDFQLKELPECPECGGMGRPGVVWFGETLPGQVMDDSIRMARNSDLTLSVGTSGVVFPAAGIPLAAKESGGLVIEVNPEPSELSPYMDHCLRGPSGEVLPALVKLLLALR